jgi:hypothetical protein
VAALAAAALVAGLCACRQQGQGAGAPAASGGPAATATGGRVAPIDACSLLTAGDAAVLLGGPVENPTVSGHPLPVAGNSSRCAYLTKSPPLKVVNLLVEQLATPREAMSAYDHTRSISKLVSGMEPQDIPNLGDKAFWEGGSIDKLHVLKGNLWLVIGCSVGPGRDQQAPATQTAAKILAHF